ncbi:hypothetical protein MPER_05510 [Moniliophthora perniciosa FA553]|nr:hypothetical protein MPER_05510 [Moniliophthora perniciosa FA553]
MSSSIGDELSHFSSVERIIVSPVATLSAMYFVYGLYILLFGTAFHLMHSGHRRPDDEWLNRKMYLSLMVVLFVLSTAFVVDYTIGAVEESSAFFTAVKTLDDQPLVDYLHKKTILTALYFLIPILLNVTAEYMLVRFKINYTVPSSSKHFPADSPLLCDLGFQKMVGNTPVGRLSSRK